MIGAILLCHLVGDYVLQSHWMATEKTKRWWPAVVHGVTYTLPFLFITQSPAALIIIAGTHIIIDRFRLARHVAWLKNQLGPKATRPGHTPTGFSDDLPPWLSFWLMIVLDNTLHLVINVAAVYWF